MWNRFLGRPPPTAPSNALPLDALWAEGEAATTLSAHPLPEGDEGLDAPLPPDWFTDAGLLAMPDRLDGSEGEEEEGDGDGVEAALVAASVLLPPTSPLRAPPPSFPPARAPAWADTIAVNVAAHLTAVVATHTRARAWAPPVADALGEALARAADTVTPAPTDDAHFAAVLRLLDSVLAGGLTIRPDRYGGGGGTRVTGLRAVAYGSFVSRTHSPRGDIDVAIETDDEGAPSLRQTRGKRAQGDLLAALAGALANRCLLADRPQLIPHARIPIAKLRIVSVLRLEGASVARDDVRVVECDVSVGGRAAAFKSAAVGALAAACPLMPPLTRLVKLWARRSGFGDGSAGGFNSFALTLLVAHNLQTLGPTPRGPPLADLAGEPLDAPVRAGGCGGGPGSAAPAPDGLSFDARVDEMLARATATAATSHAPRPPSAACLAAAFASFMAALAALLERWRSDPDALVGARASVWRGAWAGGAFDVTPRAAGVEDPFDPGDNCGRSLTVRGSAAAANAASAAAAALVRLDRPADADALVARLFGDVVASGRRDDAGARAEDAAVAARVGRGRRPAAAATPARAAPPQRAAPPAKPPPTAPPSPPATSAPPGDDEAARLQAKVKELQDKLAALEVEAAAVVRGGGGGAAAANPPPPPTAPPLPVLSRFPSYDKTVARYLASRDDGASQPLAGVLALPRPPGLADRDAALAHLKSHPAFVVVGDWVRLAETEDARALVAAATADAGTEKPPLSTMASLPPTPALPPGGQEAKATTATMLAPKPGATLDDHPGVVRYILQYVGSRDRRLVASVVALPVWPPRVPPAERAEALRNLPSFAVSGDTVALTDPAAASAALVAAGMTPLPSAATIAKKVAAEAEAEAAKEGGVAAAGAALAERPAFIKELTKYVSSLGTRPLADVLHQAWPTSLRGREVAALKGCGAFEVEGGSVRMAGGAKTTTPLPPNVRPTIPKPGLDKTLAQFVESRGGVASLARVCALVWPRRLVRHQDKYLLGHTAFDVSTDAAGDKVVSLADNAAGAALKVVAGVKKKSVFSGATKSGTVSSTSDASTTTTVDEATKFDAIVAHYVSLRRGGRSLASLSILPWPPHLAGKEADHVRTHPAFVVKEDTVALASTPAAAALMQIVRAGPHGKKKDGDGGGSGSEAAALSTPRHSAPSSTTPPTSRFDHHLVHAVREGRPLATLLKMPWPQSRQRDPASARAFLVAHSAFNVSDADFVTLADNEAAAELVAAAGPPGGVKDASRIKVDGGGGKPKFNKKAKKAAALAAEADRGSTASPAPPGFGG